MKPFFFGDELKEIAVEEVRVSPYQPRKEFSSEDLEELAASIREIGLIHPPVVRECEDGAYELIAGERRLRAVKLLGRAKVQALVRRQGNCLSAKSALIENIQRRDLNPLEIAAALKNLIEISKLTQEELADQVGKKRSTIANYLRLLQLPLEIQKKILDGGLSMGHGKAILSLPNALQKAFAGEIVERYLTVRQAEKRAKSILERKCDKAKKEGQSVFLFDLKSRLEERFGTKVEVDGSLQSGGQRGKITFEYHSLDDLDRLLEAWEIR